MDPRPSFWTGRRVCVTGGTGFLGFHLVRQLLDMGARVCVLGLPPRRDHPIWGEPRIIKLFGDICNPTVVRQAVAGCTVIFHTAGIVAVWGPGLHRMQTVHVTGTNNVLAASRPGVRVVHTSSIVTVGASRNQEPLTEDSPFNLDHLPVAYVRAKRAAEQIALAAAEQGDVVVVNPGYLLGPEDYERSIMGRFCVRFWKGRMPLAPPGGFNLVDVRDVARGHLLAAEHGQSGRRYILGGENRTFPEFMVRLAGVAGVRPRGILSPPWWILWGLAALSHCRGWAVGKEPYPSFQHVHLNRFHWFYRSDRAALELGYQARSITACLGDTYQWYADRGLLNLRGVNRWWMRPERNLERAA